MNVPELSFVIIFFFTIHEFEEIFCVRNWITKNENNKSLQKENFISGKSHYPSTETLSLMIAEEFVIISIILFLSIQFQYIEIVIALFVAYTLHLFFHLFQALKFKKWTPGSRTALITVLPILIILICLFTSEPYSMTAILIWTVVFFSSLLLNLKFLYRMTLKIEKWREKIS
jgi:hypothetical protein